MIKHGVRFERDMLSWAFSRFTATNYSGNSTFYYLTGEDRYTMFGVFAGGTESHYISTRIYGSHGYFLTATATTGTNYGTNMAWIGLDNFYNSGPAALGDTYTHFENIIKPATNCTRMDATFGFIDECSFNDNFKFWFARAMAGTAGHSAFGSRQLVELQQIVIIDAFDSERDLSLTLSTYRIGSHGSYGDDSEGTWCATMIFSGMNGSGERVYPEDVHYYGSIAYGGLEVIKSEHHDQFFGQKETTINPGDMINATIYLEL